MWLSGKIPGEEVIPYIISQFSGAILGAAIVWLIANGNHFYNLSEIGLGQNG